MAEKYLQLDRRRQEKILKEVDMQHFLKLLCISMLSHQRCDIGRIVQDSIVNMAFWNDRLTRVPLLTMRHKVLHPIWACYPLIIGRMFFNLRSLFSNYIRRMDMCGSNDSFHGLNR